MRRYVELLIQSRHKATMKLKNALLLSFTFCCSSFVLADSEKTLPQSGQEIHISVFEDHDKQLTFSSSYGLSWKLITKAAEVNGIPFVKVKTNWNSSINRLKQDKIDLVFGAFKTEERQKWALFSSALASDSSALFTKPEADTLSLLNINFEVESVGVIEGSTQATLARKLGFKHIYPSKMRKQLYDLLTSGRINYILLGHSSIKLYCGNKIECVKQVGAKLDTNYIHIMGNKHSAKAFTGIKMINDGLHRIAEQKETKDMFIQYGYSLQEYEYWKSQL